MKKTHAFVLTIFICFLFAFGQDATAAAPINYVFTVNSTADTHDATPGDNLCADSAGNCTLRAAVEEANLTIVGDVIKFSLPLPNEISLTLGQIAIVNTLEIVGPGARQLTVQRSFAQGTPNFRLFSFGREGLTVCNISGLTFANGNAGSETGGAFYVGLPGSFLHGPPDNWLSLQDVTLKNNTARRGGAVANNSGNVYLNRTTVYNNFVPDAADADGGAVYNQPGARLDADNSTITNNSANKGGAIMNDGVVTLNNVTISHNTAANTGGGIYSATGAGSFYSRNALVANNSAVASAPDVFGTFNSDGNNLVGDASGANGFTNGVNGDIAGTAAAPVNPLLGALQNNGGQTDTRAIGAGSPAIDHGNNCVLGTQASCSSFNRIVQYISDQRNHYKRGIGAGVDIGAFETGSSPVIYRRTLQSGATYPDTNRPLRGALISFTDRDGAAKYCVTGPSGRCKVSDLIVGEIYIIEYRTKGRADGVFVLYFDVSPTQLPFNIQTNPGITAPWMMPANPK